jgi:hypothetical protein
MTFAAELVGRIVGKAIRETDFRLRKPDKKAGINLPIRRFPRKK